MKPWLSFIFFSSGNFIFLFLSLALVIDLISPFSPG